MVRKFTFLLLCICASAQLSAQELYKKGYILTSPIDTLHGEIKYISYNQAAKRCIFRDSSNVESTYLPAQIYGYGIGQQLFFLSRKTEKQIPLFLEVLYQGSITLYSYRENSSRNFFYLESTQTGEFRKLTEKTIKRGTKQKTFKTYAEVIKIMLAKSELVADEIEQTSLSAKSLVRLLSAYDERYANTQGIIYTSIRETSPPQIGLFAGSGYSSLTLNGHRGKATNNVFSFGLRFEKEVSRGTKRLFIDLDFIVTHEEHSGQFDATQLVNQNSDIVSNFLNIALPAGLVGVIGIIEYHTLVEHSRTLISTPVSLKYKLPGKQLNLTFTGGINLQYATTDEILVDGRILQHGEEVFSLASLVKANPFRLGMQVGIGLAYNAKRTIFLDVRHSPSWFDQGVLNYSYSTLMLGVMLNKNR